MHFEITGQNSPSAKTVVLSAGLGGSGRFWQPQLSALGEHFRVVTYDQYGTGRSPGVIPGGYTLADMAAELAALLRSQQIERYHFVGHALGGMIGLQLALTHPQSLERLVAVNSWPVLDSQTRRCFHVRQDLLLNSGVAAYVRAQPLFLYPADWLSRHAVQLEQEEAEQVAHFQGMENLLRRLNALMNSDFRAQLAQISTPTLALCATDDLLVPYPCSQALAELLPFGEWAQMSYGGHGMSVTNSEQFNGIVLSYLRMDIDRSPRALAIDQLNTLSQ
ncbi:pyrimidine utilization protein D [Yersinia mollaretii]|uniref:Putative carbamate hydrolase RutD n=1 Tax=Yersinia mollaretii TaxID=33060 RepID=A0AA44CIS1_YERMO|nr:pyrimidine utilization protein D [Yersinia mollaretii]NIL21563.1 pyrimidine utilization protein D [Yersinia mollaretii]CNJ30214.1 putative hydrolase [Yersinia mollaretii]CNK75034.1 putative hydrolase [Yersinia enterocolitica]CQR13111.1 putative hydrolase [Yersinia mollaretii]